MEVDTCSSTENESRGLTEGLAKLQDKRQYIASNYQIFAWSEYQRGLFDTTRSSRKTSAQTLQSIRDTLAKNAARSLQHGNTCGSIKLKSTPTKV